MSQITGDAKHTSWDTEIQMCMHNYFSRYSVPLLLISIIALHSLTQSGVEI